MPDNLRGGTHSIAISQHPRGLVRQLLGAAHEYTPGIPVSDTRPLIDKLHEATFHNPIGLQWYADKRALRDLLRKAHRFILDDATSSMVADFSMAIAGDLDAARRMAIPPFPVTWIDINNVARLRRVQELGAVLTKAASTDPVERAGWLIHQDLASGGWFAHYIVHVEQGIMAAPLVFCWHTGAASTRDYPRDAKAVERLTLGVENTGVSPNDALIGITPMHVDTMSKDPQVVELMLEISGELRHIWGCLIAIAAPQGAEVKTSDAARVPQTHWQPNGKPLLPLEHKLLHLHLGKRQSVDKVVIRAMTHHRMRWHEVRAHWRRLRSGKLVAVQSHARGDEQLGRIEKTYKVER